MDNNHRRTATVFLSVAMTLALVGLAPLVGLALGQRFVTVPVGTVIPLRMDTYLSSDSSRVGDRFTATVFRPVTIEGRIAVPQGATVEGHVTGATPTERGSKAGTFGIAFDRLAFPNGNSIPVDGTLTTLSEEGRQKIEQDINDEDRVEGGTRTRRAVMFIGGGAGAGAVIGAVTGGAKGAAVGAGLGAILGTVGVFLSKGEKAEVHSGTEFGMMVERSFSVDTNSFNAAGDTIHSSHSVLTSTDSIRSAQIALRDRNYYNGPINGLLNQTTRDAIRSFQRDRNLPYNGDLDAATAEALGISSNSGSAPTVFSSTESIRFAQTTLRDRGYYSDRINGQMTGSTRNAIRQFQRDNNLTMSGDLDPRTARLLGVASQAGFEARPIEIMNPRAERIDRERIRISLDVHTQGAGWQIFVNRFVSTNTLHLYVRGVPPQYSTGTAVDHHPFTETYDNLPNATRVVIHGPQRDFTVDLAGSGSASTTEIGNPRQIAFLANRLLQGFQRDLNVRNSRGQLIFDNRRDFRPNEVDLLSQINSLQGAADFYSRLTTSITDPDAVKGAADSLVRQARMLDRMMKRYTQLTLSSTVSADWERLQAEIARINVTDTNPDNDILR